MSKVNNKGATISVGSTGIHGERAEDDFYATQPKTVKSLLDVFPLKGSVLEPSCGMGHISEVLKEYYPNQEVISTDLTYRGYGEGNIDFLTHDYNRKFDNIITNPPFSLAKEFVEKGLEITNDKVIMLLKIQFLEGQARKDFLMNSPLKYIYVFSARQSTLKNGLELNPLNNKPWSTTLLLAWFIWEKGYEGEPIIRWL
jgi:hypothetical protein